MSVSEKGKRFKTDINGKTSYVKMLGKTFINR